MSLTSSLKRSVFAAVIGLLIASPLRADWKEPADGKLTEKQVTDYIAIMKEWMSSLKAAGKAMEGNNSGMAAMAVMGRTNEKFKASIAAHGMSQEEFDWVGGKVSEAWAPAMMKQQWETDGKPNLLKQQKENDAKIEAAKQKLATYEAAQKDGKRVMTKEDREAAIARAGDDQKSITEELNGKQAEIKETNDAITKAEADAKAADALAAKPPADVSDDDKPGYIEGKKGEVATAKESAKDARERLEEQKKALADIQTRLTAAKNKAKHPEVPQTDDEKAQVRQENDAAIASAKSDIDSYTQAGDMLKESATTGEKQITEMMGQANPANVELMTKHVEEWKQIWGGK